MKQIIVNVSELRTKEKQRVNEALAKIFGVQMCIPPYWSRVSAMRASSPGVTVGFYYDTEENQTHTPRQVLEMAGMAEKRKVRADFDPNQPIRVDVSNCTEEEKEEVQQAFFDVGITWFSGSIGRESEVASFRYLGAVLYTNSTAEGTCSKHLMFGTSPRTDSISPQQFLSMVYEPVQQGHVHAENMALYAEDALTNPEPWKLWQIKSGSSDWISCQFSPAWDPGCQFRRKPKTKLINGVEIPDFQFTPYVGCNFYCANIGLPEFYETGNMGSADCTFTKRMVERGLIYPYTEEGKQAAIQHAKILIGIT